MRTRVLVPIAAVLAVVVAAVIAILSASDDNGVADFGVAPPENGAALPGDVGLDLDDVEAADDLPPRDTVIDDATWPQVAGWIARENAEGRPVVVNLWASWCEPCEREIPLLNAAADDNPDVAFLGVAANDAAEDARAAIDDFGITFPSVRDAEFDQVAFTVGARVMPTTVVFDTEGAMVGRVIGELSQRSLEDLLGSVQ
ncbi:MAG: TlpA disulfide reductase family protein [Egicoccus sp.]